MQTARQTWRGAPAASQRAWLVPTPLAKEPKAGASEEGDAEENEPKCDNSGLRRRTAGGEPHAGNEETSEGENGASACECFHGRLLEAYFVAQSCPAQAFSELFSDRSATCAPQRLHERRGCRTTSSRRGSEWAQPGTCWRPAGSPHPNSALIINSL